MKRVLLSVIALVTAMSVFAIDMKNKVKITIHEPIDDYTREVYVGESDDLEPGVNVSYCEELGTLGALTGFRIYAVYGSKAYSTFRTKSLKNVAIGIRARNKTNYELTFTNEVDGVILKDMKTGTEINSKTAGTYNFTIEASEMNTEINDRFVLFYTPPTLDVCFVDNVLQIKENPYSENIVITNEAGEDVLASPYSAATESVNMSSLSAGLYYVTFSDGVETYKYVVSKE